MAGTDQKFTISNNGIAMILSVWAVFTNVKDGISAWAVSRASQATINEKVVKLDQLVTTITGEVSSLKERNAQLEGSLKSEISRSYSSDESTQKAIEFLTSIVKTTLPQQRQDQPTVPKQPQQ